VNPTRRKKLLWIIALVAALAVAVGITLYALSEQADYFYNPTQVAEGEAPQDTRMRVGGMVVAGSVYRNPASPLQTQFVVTDFQSKMTIEYTGILPDLFAENSGVVAQGKLQGDLFIADQVLAKHDEKYMPPEVAASLKKQPEAL
jgi:cytochrome c-type biogenesis protein CcmE